MRKTLPLLLALLISLGSHAQNFDFQHSIGTNKTLYFKILSPSTVGLTYPNYVSNNYYSGYTKPKGHIAIPSTVTHGGTTYTVTSITFNAFYQCDSITSVTIPASVTSIGDYAFYGCSEITNLDLGSGVTTIGQYAFYGNHHLTELTIPRQMASIGENAFSNCSQMRTVNFNADSCQAFPVYIVSSYSARKIVFGGSTPIKTVNFGSHVKYIPANMLINKTSVDTISIPNSVRSIGSSAFRGCYIQHVNWGTSLDTIGSGAFSYNSFQTLTLPPSLKHIGSAAFSDNSIITELTIPANIEEVCNAAFANWSALTTVNFNADSCINPSTSTYQGWFSDCPSITTINIGNNVKNIPHAAFNGTKIVNLIIPNSVVNIETSAFSGCINLLGIIMGNGVHNIGHSAFQGCSSLSNIQMGSSVEFIGNYAFSSCTTLASITIPSAQTVGSNAFFNCTGLQTVALPDGLDTIKSDAFMQCYMLSNIALPNTLKFIGERSFVQCTSLSSITIPSSVTYIGLNVTQGCSSLTDIYFNADSCTWMSDVPGWTRESAFQNSNPSMNILIGNNVKYIPPYAFYGCNNVSEITIPASVVCIGNGALSGMGNLSLIHSFASVPPTATSNYITESSKFTIPVYVPCNAILDYQQAPGWSNFSNYQMLSGDYSMHVVSDNSEQGAVEYLESPCETGQATIQAVPANRFRFVGWSDGSTDNPRTLTLTHDTVITATFEPDTFIVSAAALPSLRGTIIGAGTYYRGDTATIYAFPAGGFVFDNWNGNATDNPLRFPVDKDTLLSASFSLPPTDTILLHDTTYINNFIYDTTYINVPYAVHDTTYITLTDTLTVVQTDTVTLLNTDTVIITQLDTLTILQTDTLYLHDTVYITNTVHDTVYITNTIHDTVYITDTVYVGVDDVKTVDVKLYQQGGDVVVEGAEGQPVAVYDAVGRLLATRRDTYGPVRFAAPAAGTYLVRVGSAAARRIVVVR